MSPPNSGRIERLAFCYDSASYFAALADLFRLARRRIRIIGWSFDDRILLTRGDEGRSSASVGDLLIEQARQHPGLLVELYIWRPPSLFEADQHITRSFKRDAARLKNVSFRHIPAGSAFAARHEKLVIIDDVLAALGGIDLTSGRWDTVAHLSQEPRRRDPSGESYMPYQDLQALFSGPLVEKIWRLLAEELPGSAPWSPAEELFWPDDLSPLIGAVEGEVLRTSSSPVPEEEGLHEISDSYRELIASAERSIYIENQYFSSDKITEQLASRLEEQDGPEVVIVMSRELPDAMGRLTMGLSASMHIAKLKAADQWGRLGFYNLFSSDDDEVAVKVHTKLMIVDGRYATFGSANISRRSFQFDNELNLFLDAHLSDRPDAVEELQEILLAQHCGLEREEWRELLERKKGSLVAALSTRVDSEGGIGPPGKLLAPGTIPEGVIEPFDMAEAPKPEAAMQEVARRYPRQIVKQVKWAALILLAAALLLGGIYLLMRVDIDLQLLVDSIRRLKEERPVVAGLFTIGAYWLATALFLSVNLLIIGFAALYGPFLGILYATVGILTAGSFFYILGLLLHNNRKLDRFKLIQRAKAQFQKIRHYGTWAVAISRIVPTAPFVVVNLVTGLMGFRPRQFIAGSLLGLMPGIIAFSVFGNTIRRVFTDPTPANILWFVLVVAGYILLMKGLVTLVGRFTGGKVGGKQQKEGKESEE